MSAPAPVNERRERIKAASLRVGAVAAILGSAWLGGTTDAQAAAGQPPAPGCDDGIELSVRTAPPAAVIAGQAQTFDYTVCDHVASPSKHVTEQVVKLANPKRPVDYPGNATAMTPEQNSAYPARTGTWQVPTSAAAGNYAVVIKFFSSPGVINAEATVNFQVATPPPVTGGGIPVPPPAPPPAAAPPAPPVTPIPAPAPAAAPAPAPVFTPRAATPAPAKLKLTKRANKRVVRERSNVRFVMKVTNIGRSDARAVVLCDKMPAGLSVVRAPGAQMKRGQVCWTRPSLAPGKSWTRFIDARVDGNIGRARLFVNRADAKAINTNRAKAKASVMGVGTRTKTKVPVTG